MVSEGEEADWTTAEEGQRVKFVLDVVVKCYCLKLCSFSYTKFNIIHNPLWQSQTCLSGIRIFWKTLKKTILLFQNCIFFFFFSVINIKITISS